MTKPMLDKNVGSVLIGKHFASTGQVFGRLTVVGVGVAGAISKGFKKEHMCECVCACGNKCFVPIQRLVSGNTKSCGCLTKTAGGLGDTPEYKVWKEMRRRCEDPTHGRFATWGGRGIFVCAEWAEFSTFISDIGIRPSSNHSLERRDNDGPYAPWNCYWATRVEQANNTRGNRVLVFMGRAQSMSLWCRELCLNYNTVRSRIYLKGWSTEKALTTPVRIRRKVEE